MTLGTQFLTFLSCFGFILAVAKTHEETAFGVRYQNSKIPSDVAFNFLEMSKNGSLSEKFEKISLRKDMGHQDMLCYLPDVNSDDILVKQEINSSNNSSITSKMDKIVKRLNKALNNEGCIYLHHPVDRYWSFRYCPGERISQYHIQSVKGGKGVESHVISYTLAQLREDKIGKHSSATIEKAADYIKVEDLKYVNRWDAEDPTTKYYDGKPYLIQKLANGEVCDLTGKPRDVEIVYKCDQNSREAKFIDVKESKTCSYRITIVLPQLCRFPELREGIQEEIPIECKAISSKSSGISSEVSLQEFMSFKEEVRSRGKLFHIEKYHLININDYQSISFGNGFSAAVKKNKPTANSGLKNWFVLIYTGSCFSPEVLIEKLKMVMSYSVELKIYSPLIENGAQRLLSWNDFFVIWFEMYDFSGRLRNIVRIENSAGMAERLDIQIIDPETFKNQYGEMAPLSILQDSLVANNFEAFEPSAIEISVDPINGNDSAAPAYQKEKSDSRYRDIVDSLDLFSLKITRQSVLTLSKSRVLAYQYIRDGDR